MRRWFTIVMVCTLALSLLLTGCSSNGNTGNNGEQNNNGSENAEGSNKDADSNQKEEPIEIAWLSFNFPKEDDSLVQKWMEEKFNVKIKNIRLDRPNWSDQLNIKLASGELPDVWLLWGTNDIVKYSEQGLLGELPIEEIKQSMPTLAKFIDENQPGAWYDGLIDGKSYGIPITNLEGVLPINPVYNADWLKKIGYNEPPKTLEQLEDVVYKFRNDDPDGNGKKDTYGLTAWGRGSLTQSLQYVFGAFHVLPGNWSEDENGKLVFDMTTDKMREAFKVLNKWFEDGVLDPEFITNDGKSKDFETGRVGVTSEIWSHLIPSQTFAQDAAANGVNLAIGKALVGPYGPGKLQAWGLTGNYLGMSVDAAKDSKKKAKIYEILNSFYSDEESYLMTQYGEAGVHYDLVDGKPVRKPEYKDAQVRQNLGMGLYYGLMSLKSKEFEKYTYTKEDLALREEITEGVDRMFSKVKFVVPGAANYPDLNNMVDEHMIKFITGEVDLDQGFDQFVKNWYSSGGEEITKQANEIYQQNMTSSGK